MNPVKIFSLSLLLCLTAFAKAQVCTGSLGDPIINVNFDNGLNGTTNYTYTSGTPNDGLYTITSTTNGMYSSWWHITDHTGNPGGKMMVVNASISKTDYFYKQTISGLCPGTTYEFAAWLLNLVKVGEILPNITFSVQTADGVVKTYATGDIPNSPDGTFTKYGIFFTTPVTGGDVLLTMTNNANGGTGNDIALDDITFRACGPTVTSSFSSTSSVTTLNACAGSNQSYTLEASASSGYANPYYQWQSNTGTGWTDIAGATGTSYVASFAPAVAGTYQYRLTTGETANKGSPNCGVSSNTLTLTINSPPPAVANVSTPVCEGGDITFTTSPGDSYAWTGPNGFSSTKQSPVIQDVTLADAGTYHVRITSLGCSTDVDLPVTVNPKVAASAGSDVTICKGDNTTLNASGGVSYQWSPAEGLSDVHAANPVASPLTTTTYTVTAYSSAGCSGTANVKVTVTEPPVADAGADRKTVQGNPVTLNGEVQNAGGYYWTPTDYLSDATALNPVATPPADITYTLHVLPKAGCVVEATDNVFIRVYKKVSIPNTFTPNGDGTNDTWNIEALDTYPESFTQVFNRYGKLVFESRGYGRAWDGKMNGQALPSGTYYYKIDLKNGTVFSGWVFLLR